MLKVLLLFSGFVAPNVLPAHHPGEQHADSKRAGIELRQERERTAAADRRAIATPFVKHVH